MLTARTAGQGAATLTAPCDQAMNDDEALQQARSRWGSQGYVRHQAGAVQEGFLVGIQDHVLFYVKGRGRSWEEAFAMADEDSRKLA